jgi:hypothetical protein
MQPRIPKNALSFISRRTPPIALRNISYQNLHKHVERCRVVGQCSEPTHYLDTGNTYLIIILKPPRNQEVPFVPQLVVTLLHRWLCNAVSYCSTPGWETILKAASHTSMCGHRGRRVDNLTRVFSFCLQTDCSAGTFCTRNTQNAFTIIRNFATLCREAL